MKTKIAFSVAIIALVATIVFFLLSAPHTNSNVGASALYKEKSNTPTPLPTEISGVSASAIQKYAQGKILTQRRFGIDISSANFRYENSEIKADVCFQLPSKADWRVWDATLQSGATNLLLSTIEPLELTETLENGKRQVTTYPKGSNITWQEIAHNGQPDYLCETLSFFSPIPETNLAEIDLTQVNLIIQSIGALPREGEECPFYLDIVQSRLDAKGVGIKLDCVSQDGGSRIMITQKPANMSQSDAETIISSASDESYIIKGPWIFQASAQ